MNTLFPFAVIWAVMAIAVICLIIYRKSISSHEDDSLHLEGGVSGQQAAFAQKLEVVDRWGKVLTIIALVYGIALAGIYVYQSWVTASHYLG